MSATCRMCDSDLDASGYCTSHEWCPYQDRLQAGSPPGARTSLDIARTAWEEQDMQLVLLTHQFATGPEYMQARRLG